MLLRSGRVIRVFLSHKSLVFSRSSSHTSKLCFCITPHYFHKITLYTGYHLMVSIYSIDHYNWPFRRHGAQGQHDEASKGQLESEFDTTVDEDVIKKILEEGQVQHGSVSYLTHNHQSIEIKNKNTNNKYPRLHRGMDPRMIAKVQWPLTRVINIGVRSVRNGWDLKEWMTLQSACIARMTWCVDMDMNQLIWYLLLKGWEDITQGKATQGHEFDEMFIG